MVLDSWILIIIETLYVTLSIHHPMQRIYVDFRPRGLHVEMGVQMLLPTDVLDCYSLSSIFQGTELMEQRRHVSQKKTLTAGLTTFLYNRLQLSNQSMHDIIYIS